jgi:hypothetical protein
MQAPVMTKFGFRIRTRDGMTVENLLIYGRDGSDAERKLRQMYHECEILDCVATTNGHGHGGAARMPSINFEDIARLIATH